MKEHTNSSIKCFYINNMLKNTHFHTVILALLCLLTLSLSMQLLPHVANQQDMPQPSGLAWTTLPVLLQKKLYI